METQIVVKKQYGQYALHTSFHDKITFVFSHFLSTLFSALDIFSYSSFLYTFTLMHQQKKSYLKTHFAIKVTDKEMWSDLAYLSAINNHKVHKWGILIQSDVVVLIYDRYVINSLLPCVGLPFFIRVLTWSPSGRVRSWAIESTLLGPTGFTLAKDRQRCQC